jgi:hypothetical protein
VLWTLLTAGDAIAIGVRQWWNSEVDVQLTFHALRARLSIGRGNALESVEIPKKLVQPCNSTKASMKFKDQRCVLTSLSLSFQKLLLEHSIRKTLEIRILLVPLAEISLCDRRPSLFCRNLLISVALSGFLLHEKHSSFCPGSYFHLAQKILSTATTNQDFQRLMVSALALV